MKTVEDKHRLAGTLPELRARQRASREGQARYAQRMREQAEALPSPEAAIERAIALGVEAANYLRDWQEGDVSHWPED